MRIRQQSWLGRALVPVLLALQSLGGYVVAAAQTTSVKVDINKPAGGGGTAWYSTWWFWVLVGLFALIVIIAITSRGRTTAVKQ